MTKLTPERRIELLEIYFCAMCLNQASFVPGSDVLICETCQTGRWLTMPDPCTPRLAQHPNKRQPMHVVDNREDFRDHLESFLDVVERQQKATTKRRDLDHLSGQKYAIFQALEILSDWERRHPDPVVPAIAQAVPSKASYYFCASCESTASFVLDSDALICENCRTGRWLTKKPDPGAHQDVGSVVGGRPQAGS